MIKGKKSGNLSKRSIFYGVYCYVTITNFVNFSILKNYNYLK